MSIIYIVHKGKVIMREEREEREREVEKERKKELVSEREENVGREGVQRMS